MKKNLEQSISGVIGLIALFISFLFLSPELTANAIGATDYCLTGQE